MRKKILPLILACTALSFAFTPVIKAGNKDTKNSYVTATPTTSVVNNGKSDYSSTVASASAMLFDSLQLNKLGLSQEAFDYAYKGFKKLDDNGELKNDNILTVCDFSQSSFKKRMYIIDVKNFKVLLNTYVAHGKNSGLQYAKNFSNVPESLASSLGFYVTKSTYFGKHGLSLKLDGKESGINNNAEDRAIVVHGADYIGDNRLGAAFMGRSFGCPAVPQELSAKVINYIKNGTCLFIYHPSKKYLVSSKILNA